MDTPRVKMGHKLGETPPNIFADFDWVRRNEAQLLDTYGERSIIVFEQHVIGVGLPNHHTRGQIGLAKMPLNLPDSPRPL